MSVDDLDLNEAEREALHELQLGIESVRRGHGALLEFHHELGSAFDHFDALEAKLREAGYNALADELRDEVLPAGVVGDRWTYELVEAFETGFLEQAEGIEEAIRADLAEETAHVHERELQRRWRNRAEGWED